MFHLPRLRLTRPYRTSVALEEERLWVGFYRRVANPAIAAEVIQHLDGDADQKRTHPALYLRCKESLRKKKARQARTKRIRSFMRRILGGLLRDPERRTRGKLKSLPETPELAAAQTDGGQPNASRPSAPRLDASATAPRNAKAA
jgi:hypothetical protein